MTEPDRTIRVTASATFGGRAFDVSLEEPGYEYIGPERTAVGMALSVGTVLAHAINGGPVLDAKANRLMESDPEDLVDATIVDDGEEPNDEPHDPPPTAARMADVLRRLEEARAELAPTRSELATARSERHLWQLRAEELEKRLDESARLRRVLTRIANDTVPNALTKAQYARNILTGGPE